MKKKLLSIILLVTALILIGCGAEETNGEKFKAGENANETTGDDIEAWNESLDENSGETSESAMSNEVVKDEEEHKSNYTSEEIESLCNYYNSMPSDIDNMMRNTISIYRGTVNACKREGVAIPDDVYKVVDEFNIYEYVFEGVDYYHDEHVAKYGEILNDEDDLRRFNIIE